MTAPALNGLLNAVQFIHPAKHRYGHGHGHAPKSYSKRLWTNFNHLSIEIKWFVSKFASQSRQQKIRKFFTTPHQN